MLTSLTLATAVLVALHLAFTRLASVPVKYRDLSTPRIRYLLELLYVRGSDGAFLHVAHRGGEWYLRVYKQILGLNSVRLRVDVPQLVHRHRGTDATLHTLSQGGFAAPSSIWDQLPTSRSDAVDGGQEISAALVMLEHLLHEVLKVDPEQDCVAHIDGAHPNPRAHPGFAVAPEL